MFTHSIIFEFARPRGPSNSKIIEWVNIFTDPTYTLYRNWWYAHFHFWLWSRFEWEPLKLHRQMIPDYLALDVCVKISKAQLCSSIRGCHANFLLKSTLFKEPAWQPLIKQENCSSSILDPPTRAFKWSINCLYTIKKCWFYRVSHIITHP